MNQKEHLLVCMEEEAIEISSSALNFAKICSKTLRFGLDSLNPDTQQSNIKALSGEFNDLIGAIELFEEKYAEIIISDDRTAIEAKKDKIRKHMRCAAEAGTLNFESKEDNLDLLAITDDMRAALRKAGIVNTGVAFETKIPTFMEAGIESQSELEMLASALFKYYNGTRSI